MFVQTSAFGRGPYLMTHECPLLACRVWSQSESPKWSVSLCTKFVVCRSKHNIPEARHSVVKYDISYRFLFRVVVSGSIHVVVVLWTLI
jgi:hypothetical protein